MLTAALTALPSGTMCARRCQLGHISILYLLSTSHCSWGRRPQEWKLMQTNSSDIAFIVPPEAQRLPHHFRAYPESQHQIIQLGGGWKLKIPEFPLQAHQCFISCSEWSVPLLGLGWQKRNASTVICNTWIWNFIECFMCSGIQMQLNQASDQKRWEVITVRDLYQIEC